jgi:hypothetical protein
VLLSPSLRQSREVALKVRTFLGDLADQEPLLEDNKLSTELRNHSRVISVPAAETLRGYAADLVLVDEAAFIEDAALDAVRAMIGSTGGRLILSSTAHGKAGEFYRVLEGDPSVAEDWERLRVRWEECPRITAEFIQQERRGLPASTFASEWLGQFAELVDGVFAADDIASMFDSTVEPLWPDRVEVYAGIA